MKKANDGRPYYGDEPPLSLWWFLMEPLIYVPLIGFVCASILLGYWAFT